MKKDLQREKDQVVARVEELARRVAEAEGVELDEVELSGTGKKRVLRVTIDKPGGVTIRDCERFSRHLSVLLDLEDPVPGGSYTLEVSSPGIERKLWLPRHFERSVGKKIRVWLAAPVDGRTFWEGHLEEFSGDKIVLTVGRSEHKKKQKVAGQRVEIPLELISKANVVFEW